MADSTSKNGMTTASDFLGTGWDFPPTFRRGKKGVAMTNGAEDIQRSLHVLLSTTLGERVMLPDYGCDLTNLIFEPLTTTFKTYIEGLVRTAIDRYEPRINADRITINDDDELNGVVEVEVDFTIRTTNTRHNYVYPFYLTEGTSTRA